jgi:site-specific DNA recombinase
MTKAYSYLRTSGDDGKQKAGLPVQRESVAAFAVRSAFEIVQEFADDGVTGKINMAARPQGKLLIAALLADGVKHVLCYDAKRIGRTQPAFWNFIGLCRDSGVTVLDSTGTDLGGSVMGGVNGMLSEMDRESTLTRLAAGKAIAKAKGQRTDGAWPFGESPLREHDSERKVVERIIEMHDAGANAYRIAKTLNLEGLRTRSAHLFSHATVTNILKRGKQ